MGDITTLPGTIEFKREDRIAFYKEHLKNTGYSEQDIINLVDSLYARSATKPTYRELRAMNNKDDKKRFNK